MQIELNSRLIEIATYDEEKRFLRLFLTNGTLREFVDVPVPTVEMLAAAKSPGEFYMTNIRGRFETP